MLSALWHCKSQLHVKPACLSGVLIRGVLFRGSILLNEATIYKLDAESRELRDLESRGPDVASRA